MNLVFGIVDAVLLDPLPFHEPDRLLLLSSENRADGSRNSFSFPDFRDVREATRTMEGIAAFGEESLIAGGDEGAERVLGELITSDYLPLLRVDAVLGRRFSGDEATPVALLTDALYRRRFGADPSVLGQEIVLNDARFQIVGVLPAGFRGFSGNAELFVPMEAFDSLHPELKPYDNLNNRGTRWHSVLARLGKGVELAAARAELDGVAAALRDEHPGSNDRRGIVAVPAYDQLVGDYKRSLLLLLAAVGFLLLLACANIANLFLTRVLARRGELAIRVALGASRARLARQLLTETTLFSVVGGLLGLGLAQAAFGLIVELAPVDLPSYVVPSLSPEVVVFAFLLAVGTGVAFGVLPAMMQTARAGFVKLRAQSMLAFAEITLATLLLIGAGLLLKSFVRMQSFEPGFDASGLLTMRFYVPETAADALDQIAEEASHVPGVESAAVASHIYFGGGYMSGELTVEGLDGDRVSYRNYVGEDYFRVMGMALWRGRAFEARDGEDAPPVVVVNQSFAASTWPGEEALGKRLRLGASSSEQPWSSVVGVVPDVKPRIRMTAESALPQVYIPIRQGGAWSRALVVRASGEASALGPALVRALQQYDPGIAVFSVASMEQLLARGRETARAVSYFMGAFAGLALVLAAFGLYALVSYSVSRSMRELGIRVALGALRSHVLRLVLTRTAAVGALGLGVGLLAAAALTRVLASLLYEVTPLDSVTFGAVGAMMLVVVLLASLGPALCSAKVDPMTTLRQD